MDVPRIGMPRARRPAQSLCSDLKSASLLLVGRDVNSISSRKQLCQYDPAADLTISERGEGQPAPELDICRTTRPWAILLTRR